MHDHQKLVEIFLASTLHEAKNQLGALRTTYRDAFESINLSLSAPESQRAEHQLEKLNQLLNQVLTHYRSLNSNYSIHLDEIYIEDYLEELVERLTPSLTANGVTLLPDLEGSAAIYIDEQLINNVLDTLIWNASAAGADTIHLSFDSADDKAASDSSEDTLSYHRIYVDDNGSGFSQSMLNQSFDALTPANARENKTGLGLYFANAILAAHHNKGRTGFIRLENHKSGLGARVTLFIP